MIGIVAQAALIVVLVRGRTYRSLPIFFLYIVWGVAGDCAVLILRTVMPSLNQLTFEIEMYFDSLFQYLVLIELAWSILRPIQRSLPRGFLIGISFIIAASAVLAWPLTAIKETLGCSWQLLVALHAQRSFAILRILFFVALAFCSQLLGIGWRNRELQIATGLGFYSLVSLTGSMVHSHQVARGQYYYVELAIACTYSLSLMYWVYCFAQREVARREITPKMLEFLLGMADVMRLQRVRLSGPTINS